MKEMELKYGQDDFKDLRVITEAKKVVNDLVKQSPHTILVWEECKFKEHLQTAFKNSKNTYEQNIQIVENKTVPENTIVLMNKFGEPLEAIELTFEEVENETES